MAETVVLKVNGEEVRLNAFVRKALAGVLEGFISSLDEVPGPVREVEVQIKR